MGFLLTDALASLAGRNVDSPRTAASRGRPRGARLAPRRAGPHAAVERVEDRVLLAAVTVVNNVNISKSTVNEVESAIAINPSNPQQLFATSDDLVTDEFNQEVPGMLVSRSSDGGATWTAPQHIATGAAGDLPAGCCDASLAWDQFGNLFMAYDNTQFGGTHVTLARSSDGGATFSVISEWDTGGGQVSEPSVAIGPDGTAGTGSVWIDYDSDTGIVVHGAQVTGLGAVGAFTNPADTPLPGSVDGGLPDIAVGPTGQVVAAYAWAPDDGSNYAINSHLDADGLGAADFGAATLVTTTNMSSGEGYFAASGMDNFGNWRYLNPSVRVAWDRSGGPNHGRLYLSYADDSDPESIGDHDVFLRRSDDAGATWSSRVRVNDDSVGNVQFHPALALDQTSGALVVSFYDGRVDPVSEYDANYFGALSVTGGTSFQPNFRISNGTSQVYQAGSYIGNNPLGFGDQSNVAFHAGRIHASWSDNSNSTGDNPSFDGYYYKLDHYTARVDVSRAVANRRVFYNNSVFDGNDAAANTLDDNAVAPDKRALTPGHTATSANFTDYHKGLNGVMIDAYSIPAATLSASDFTFKVGNDQNPAGWAVAPAPTSVTVRKNFSGNTDRITITWPDQAIKVQWLQVTMAANANTGLSAPDVFYFGNLPADVNGDGQVTAPDEDIVKQHLNEQNVPITAPWDINRDGRCNALDVAAVKQFLNSSIIMLIAP